MFKVLNHNVFIEQSRKYVTKINLFSIAVKKTIRKVNDLFLVSYFIYFFFLSSSNRLDKSSKSMSSLSSFLGPAGSDGTSGRSEGTLGRFGKSSMFDGILDRG